MLSDNEDDVIILNGHQNIFFNDAILVGLPNLDKEKRKQVTNGLKELFEGESILLHGNYHLSPHIAIKLAT